MYKTDTGESVLVLAPSCAGKSTIVKKAGYPDTVVDGDYVIANSVGWPTEHRWWEVLNPEQKQAVHRNNMRVLDQWMSVKPVMVLFNGDPGRLRSFKHKVVVWMPNESELIRNVEARARAQGPNSPQPSTLPEIMRNVDALKTIARDNALRVIDTATVEYWAEKFASLKVGVISKDGVRDAIDLSVMEDYHHPKARR